MSAADKFIAGDMANGLVSCTHCVLCGSEESGIDIDCVQDFFFQADPGCFSLARCASCASLWLRERPVGDRLLSAYARYYTHNEAADVSRASGIRGRLRSAYLDARFAATPGAANRVLAGALRLAGTDTSNIDEFYRFAPKAPARILDYGCGNGAYLIRMQPFGHDLHGAEYDPHLLDDLSRRGIQIADVGTIPDDHWDREFDHITLAHVLEHVPDPNALLAKLRRWIKPGGTLFVELPNADATGLSIFGRYWRGLEAPRHFFLPNRSALVSAFERAGFVVERQHINISTRRWVWDESMEKVPPQERPAIAAAIAAAPPETQTNAEFLTFLVRRPI